MRRLLLLAALLLCCAQKLDVDAICSLHRVVDGDTVWVNCSSGFKAGQKFKVRLAEIDAHELDEPMGREAKEYLESLLSGRCIVLDVDERYPYDRYGRVIAIVYVKLNETHYLNVNYEIVRAGYAEFVDYPNSWHPEDLREYLVSKTPLC
ncbi:MAG: thermonuclease family protein [Archaeoglobaceae archaeon]